MGVFITGQSQPTPRGDCPGGYFQVSRTACFRHSQCPDRSFCWFTPTRTHGICCPYCKYNVHAILVSPLQVSAISRIICIWCSFLLFFIISGFSFSLVVLRRYTQVKKANHHWQLILQLCLIRNKIYDFLCFVFSHVHF